MQAGGIPAHTRYCLCPEPSPVKIQTLTINAFVLSIVLTRILSATCLKFIRTPLSWCLSLGDEDPRSIMCIKLLLRAGADPTLYTHKSYSPLMYAMRSKTTASLRTHSRISWTDAEQKPRLALTYCAPKGANFSTSGHTGKNIHLKAFGCALLDFTTCQYCSGYLVRVAILQRPIRRGIIAFFISSFMARRACHPFLGN